MAWAISHRARVTQGWGPGVCASGGLQLVALTSSFAIYDYDVLNCQKGSGLETLRLALARSRAPVLSLPLHQVTPRLSMPTSPPLPSPHALASKDPTQPSVSPIARQRSPVKQPNLTLSQSSKSDRRHTVPPIPFPSHSPPPQTDQECVCVFGETHGGEMGGLGSFSQERN